MADSTFTELDDSGLVTTLVTRQHELVRARFARSMGRLEDTSSIGGIRKDIARIKTELRRREIAGDLPNGSLERKYASSVERPGAAAEESAPSGGLLAGAVDKLSQ